MQGGKNWILPKEIMQTGSSETLIGWKSGKTTCFPLWGRIEGAWLWTLLRIWSPNSIEECRAASKSPHLKFGYFLSISQRV